MTWLFGLWLAAFVYAMLNHRKSFQPINWLMVLGIGVLYLISQYVWPGVVGQFAWIGAIAFLGWCWRALRTS